MKNVLKIFTRLILASAITFVTYGSAQGFKCSPEMKGKKVVSMLNRTSGKVERGDCYNSSQASASYDDYTICKTTKPSGCTLYSDSAGNTDVYICGAAKKLSDDAYLFSQNPNEMCAPCPLGQRLDNNGKCTSDVCIHKHYINTKGLVQRHDRFLPGEVVQKGFCMEENLSYTENHQQQWNDLADGKRCQAICVKPTTTSDKKPIMVAQITECHEGYYGVPFTNKDNFSPALCGFKKCVKGSGNRIANCPNFNNYTPSSPSSTSTSSSSNRVCPADASANDPCLGPSHAKRGRCRNLKKSDGTTQLTCAAVECDDNYYLWLSDKGYSQGICHSESTMKKRCASKCGQTCTSGTICTPNIVTGPKLTINGVNWTPRPNGAYQGCSCQPGVSQKSSSASSKNSQNPPVTIIEANNENECNTLGGDWKNEQCVKKTETNDNTATGTNAINWDEIDEVEIPEYDLQSEETTEEECAKRSDELWSDGQCVPIPVLQHDCEHNKHGRWINKECVIVKCPEGSTGDYPDCTCSDKQKTYDQETNKCVNIECPKDSTGDYPDCTCSDKQKTYDQETNKCVNIECPKDSTGNYPNCKCDGENKTYNKETNECVNIECPKDSTGDYPDCECNGEYKIYDNKTNKCIDDKLGIAEDSYKSAHDKEQSKENRTLTALTTAATGIGGMQLAQGLAEQKADKSAEQSMNAYIATMRCEYGKGKSVKAGSEPIELPGGNNDNLMKYRNEYFALAADLKTRKEALGMKPGIESEEILDKSQLGLYDDESTGITDGAYASLYRANMLNSEKDKQEIEDAKKTSKNRVVGGGVALGAGAVIGVVGNSLINGKLGEKLKARKAKKENTVSVLDKNKIIETLTDDEIKKLFKDKGLTLESEND